MKMVDSDSKGKVVFKTNRGTYFTLTPEELVDAQKELAVAIYHKENNLPRFTVDKRNY